MNTAVTVVADRDACIGAGQCALAAPDVFDSADDGLVEVVRPDPDRTDLPAVREAVALCPAQALRLRGGE